MLHNNVLLGVSALVCLAQGAVLVEERAACQVDNVVRALRRFSTDAIPFCSSYIKIPVVTVTITGSVTATNTATITIPTTTFATSTSVTVLDVTTTAQVAKRGAIFGRYRPSAVGQLPTYVSQYPASRISSACSCLSILPSTTTTSTTATSMTTATASVTSTETDTVTTTTTSYDVVATEIANNICGVSYSSYSLSTSYYSIHSQATSTLDCCQQCQNKSDCLVNHFDGGICELVINTNSSPNMILSCPSGTMTTYFGRAVSGGTVFAGPCAIVT